MRQIKKVLAAVLTAAMLFSLTSCASAGKWILKTENVEVPVGAYLLYESVYYQYSSYYVSDSKTSPLGQSIKMDDETSITGAEWIKKNAMDTVKNMVAVNEECRRLDLTLTDNEQAVIKENVATTWDQNETTYAKIGVAKATLSFLYQYNKFNDKLFEYLYGNKGVDPVTDSKVADYFKENYSSIDYFSVSLKDSSSNALSDEAIAKIKTELEGLGDSFSSGAKTFDQIVEAYNKDHSSATVTKTSKTVIAKDSFSEDLSKAITECGEGKATVVTYNNYMYLIGKYKIADKAEEYLKDNTSTLRHEMKDEDYSKYVTGVLDGLTISTNDAAVSKYSPKWMEKKLK